MNHRKLTARIAIPAAAAVLALGARAQGPLPPADLGWKGVNQAVSRQWGGGNWTRQDWTETESDIAAMAKAGVRWARLECRLDEPDLTGLDRAVALLEKYRIRVLLLIEGRGTDPANAEARAGYKEWVAGLARHYRGRIAYYEIGNEPYVEGVSSRPGVCTQTPPDYGAGVARYLSWLKDSYTVIKSVDPGITVLFAGLSEWNAECYLDEVTAQEGYRWCDAFAFHPYGKTPDACLKRLREALRARMEKWPAPYDRLPVWITEIGFHTEPAWKHNPGLVPDEQTKARYLVEIMRMLQADGIRTPIFWYTAHEQHPVHGYGLVVRPTNGGIEYLPAYTAYKEME